MAYTGAIHGFPDASYIAEADFAQHQVAKLGTGDNGVTPAGAGEAGIGIAQNAVDVSARDTHVTIRRGGFSLATAGTGGWTKGDYLKVDASGNLIVQAGATDLCVAIAQETVAATEKGEVLILPTPIEYSAVDGA